MDFLPRFITADDFQNFWGFDLRGSIKVSSSSTNASSAVDAFLYRREKEVMDYIDAQTFRKFRWSDLKGMQLRAMQEACLYQAEYVFRNGEIAQDSGYDPDKGIIANKSDLAELVICDRVVTTLMNAGLWSKKIKTSRRQSPFYGDGDLSIEDFFEEMS